MNGRGDVDSEMSNLFCSISCRKVLVHPMMGVSEMVRLNQRESHSKMTMKSEKGGSVHLNHIVLAWLIFQTTVGILFLILEMPEETASTPLRFSKIVFL